MYADPKATLFIKRHWGANMDVIRRVESTEKIRLSNFIADKVTPVYFSQREFI